MDENIQILLSLLVFILSLSEKHFGEKANYHLTQC